jgi:hypothetical protein
LSSSQQQQSRKERFALYGIEVEIPGDWRVEFNPKGSRQRGDVVFQSPTTNRIFVSWGPLAEATKRFKTLEEHRDFNLTRVKKGQDVKTLEVSGSTETMINGHKGLLTHLTIQVRQGMMGRATAQRDLWSLHFHCSDLGRYYVVYSMLRNDEGSEELDRAFKSVTQTMSCHPKPEWGTV